MVAGPSQPKTFWEFLEIWGGTWMWDGVEEHCKAKDMTWLVEGTKRNSIMWCTDGSFNRKTAPRVSGARWQAHCVITDRTLNGSFFEITDATGSYRGKQLGLCAMHHLIAALTIFCTVEGWRTPIFCDCQGAFNMSARKLRRIRPSSSCADILRNIRSSRNKSETIIRYQHVKGHLDKYLGVDQLLLEQVMNIRCDSLANQAVTKAITTGMTGNPKQLLPSEDDAVFVNNRKLTGDLGKDVRYEVGKEKARDHLTSSENWSDEKCNEVGWDFLHSAMEKKLDGYKIWLSKQHTRHCRTQVQVGYYSGNPDGDVSCPNCGAKETAAHLCLCPNEDRVRLFTEGVDQLSKWLEGGGKTDLELQYWIPNYIKYRGTRRFQDMGQMSPNMRALAVSRDKIG